VGAENFFADPLRVIRAARFKACLPEFRPAPELLSLMQRVASAGRLDSIAPERVGREVRLACGGSKPGHFPRLLACTSCLHPWLKELVRADWKRTARIMDRLAGRELRVWMAMVHSLEDASASSGAWVLDSRNAERAEAVGRRLRLPNTMTAAGRLAATWGQAAAHYDHLPPDHRVALLLDLQAQGLVEDFWSLIRAAHGHDHLSRAQADLRTIRAVHLPPEWRNLGRRSGEYLHYLRCRSLQP
jgi:tRNA nucleotidyltransferase (CCA-adding enzyme)